MALGPSQRRPTISEPTTSTEGQWYVRLDTPTTILQQTFVNPVALPFSTGIQRHQFALFVPTHVGHAQISTHAQVVTTLCIANYREPVVYAKQIITTMAQLFANRVESRIVSSAQDLTLECAPNAQPTPT